MEARTDPGGSDAVFARQVETAWGEWDAGEWDGAVAGSPCCPVAGCTSRLECFEGVSGGVVADVVCCARC